MTLPSPSVLLGVHGKPDWYPGQEPAFRAIMEWLVDPDSRFLCVSAPTGSGKTVLALLAARMSDLRTCILTATKGLMDQYMREAGQVGGVTVRGRNNFRCAQLPQVTAEEGPCIDGLPCSAVKSGDCEYREQLRRALDARIVVTNYAYYLAQTHFSTGLGEFGLLILDEAHHAFGTLESHMSIFLDNMSVESAGLRFPSSLVNQGIVFVQEQASCCGSGTAPCASNTGQDRLADDQASDAASPDVLSPDLLAQWRDWAKYGSDHVRMRVEELAGQIKDIRSSGEDHVPSSMLRSYRALRATQVKLDRLSVLRSDCGWVIEPMRQGVRFTPCWVSGFSDRLFASVPKIILMSAILSRKTADSLGVPASARWLEIPSYFPAANTQIWHVPTARMNHRTDDCDLAIWQTRIDQVIQRRLDRKGIVFTVSYERARYLLTRSRFRDIMLTHGPGDVSYVVDRFKRASSPCVLVSPAVTTGWDFPASLTDVRYLVVGKIPYPDSRDPVVTARCESDSDWAAHLAMDTLVQECGRASRSVNDRCEVFILDDNWLWYWPRYQRFAPAWFRERVCGSLTCVPDPLV